MHVKAGAGDPAPARWLLGLCASESGQATPFGGGGVGAKDGEGGREKCDRYVTVPTGIVIAGGAGSGAGSATDKARSALPVISPQ